jgi:hypothetical protein
MLEPTLEGSSGIISFISSTISLSARQSKTSYDGEACAKSFTGISPSNASALNLLTGSVPDMKSSPHGAEMSVITQEQDLFQPKITIQKPNLKTIHEAVRPVLNFASNTTKTRPSIPTVRELNHTTFNSPSGPTELVHLVLKRFILESPASQLPNHHPHHLHPPHLPWQPQTLRPPMPRAP